ncbi:MAG: hypothetical protein ACK4NC_01925 [Candidatus Gracilibacteria bacterium]
MSFLHEAGENLENTMNGYSFPQEENTAENMSLENVRKKNREHFLQIKKSVADKVQNIMLEDKFIENTFPTFHDLETLIQHALLLDNEKEFILRKGVKKLGLKRIYKQIEDLSQRDGIEEQRLLYIKILLFIGTGDSMNYDCFRNIFHRYVQSNEGSITPIKEYFENLAKDSEISGDFFELLTHMIESQHVHQKELVIHDNVKIAESSLIRSKIFQEISESISNKDLDLIKSQIETLKEHNLFEEFLCYYEGGSWELTDILKNYYRRNTLSSFEYETLTENEELEIFHSLVQNGPKFLRDIEKIEHEEKSRIIIFIEELKKEFNNI